MILVPEIEKVVLLVPRTGSGSLYRALLEKYPKALMLYRHMEADGVPKGYDRWEKVGVLRNPLDRLWSLYKFLQTFHSDQYPGYSEYMQESVQISFDEWIVTNMAVFTSPYDGLGADNFHPEFSVNHPLPENRKSQFLTLRPDLGTTIYHYSDKHKLATDLGVELGRVNGTSSESAPFIGNNALDHMLTFFKWDYSWLKSLVKERLRP